MNGRLEREELEAYLSAGFGRAVRVREVAPLGGEAGEKGFGYGVPLKVTLEDAPVEAVVIHTSGTSGFGHDTLADRAAAAVLAYETFNNLPHHVRALELGAVDASGEWIGRAGAVLPGPGAAVRSTGAGRLRRDRCGDEPRGDVPGMGA